MATLCQNSGSKPLLREKKTNLGQQWSKFLVQDLFLKLSKCSILINICKSWKHFAKDINPQNSTIMSAIILCSFIDTFATKGYAHTFAAQGSLIELLFHPFVLASGSSSKRSHLFSTESNRKFSITLELNAPRNKLSLQGTKSSGNAHF